MDMAVTKRILLFFFVCLFFSPYRSAAQTTGIYLSGRITLDSLTHYLNLHSKIRLTYDARKIPGARPIYFPPRYYTTNALLARINTAGQLKFLFLGDHIILSKPLMPARLPATKKTEHSPVVLKKATTTRGPIVTKDTLLPAIHVRPIHIPPRPINTTSSHTPSTHLPPPAFQHLQLELTANEVFYGNITAEAGWSFLHVVAGAGITPHHLSWTAGLGSVIADNDDQQLQVRLLYSPLRASGTLIDTTNRNAFTVKGQSFRFELLWCKKLNGHWLFKAGPGLGLLRTTYYLQGSPTAPYGYFPAPENADKLLYLVKPPLLIYNGYSATTSRNYKLWPGISVTICYTF